MNCSISFPPSFDSDCRDRRYIVGTLCGLHLLVQRDFDSTTPTECIALQPITSLRYTIHMRWEDLNPDDHTHIPDQIAKDSPLINRIGTTYKTYADPLSLQWQWHESRLVPSDREGTIICSTHGAAMLSNARYWGWFALNWKIIATSIWRSKIVSIPIFMLVS